MDINGSADANPYDDDVRVEEEILQGLRRAQNLKTQRKNVKSSPEVMNRLLQKAFPNINTEYKAKILSSDEFDALRISLQRVVHEDVKNKMSLLQNQLSEYHSVLEEVIMFKNRCGQLEQEKKDLVALCNEVCQVRDDKIALLEKELAMLRSKQRNRRSSSGSTITDRNNSDWVYSSIRGDDDIKYSRGQVYHESRRITLSASPIMDTRSTCSNNYGNNRAKHLILFPQKSQDFCNYEWWNGRSTKRHKSD